MTIPAHDSVAYLPARPRLALLRKDSGPIDFVPTLSLPCDLCFGGRAAARFAAWRIGARHTRLPFEDWMRLAFDACHAAGAQRQALRVDHSR